MNQHDFYKILKAHLGLDNAQLVVLAVVTVCAIGLILTLYNTGALDGFPDFLNSVFRGEF